jgi:hypothetical protein
MSLQRLSNASLAALPRSIARPAYDRAGITPGIVHLGVGAFHRAHQAVVVDDRLAAGETSWGIIAASLRSADTRDALAPQDGLYTMAVRDGAATSLRVIGAIQEVIVAPEARERLIARLAGAAKTAAVPTLDDLLLQLNPGAYLASAAGVVRNLAADTVLILIYLGFIIASGRGLERKVLNLSTERGERRAVVTAYRSILGSVEQYLWVQTVTGLMIAAASWAAMTFVGLEGATFLSVLIFLACYIPILGAALGVVLAPVFALMQFPTLWQAIFLYAVLQGLHFVVGNIIAPRMQGRSLNMDPLVVLLSLAFWGWLWGVIGMFLSTPLTVIVMVVCAQFPGSRWVAVLLSADGRPGRVSTPKP